METRDDDNEGNYGEERQNWNNILHVYRALHSIVYNRKFDKHFCK